MDRLTFKDYLDNSSLRHILWRNIELEALKPIKYSEPIMDVACGDGFFGSKLFKETMITGFDISLNALRGAKKKENYNRIFAADACYIPVKDMSFKTVFSNSVFEHIPHVELALKEVSRVLAEGGSFIFTVPNEKFSEYLFVSDVLSKIGLRGLSQIYKNKVNEFLKHKNLDSLDIWKQRLQQAGLRIDKVIYYLPKRVVYLWDILFLPAYISDCFYKIFKKRAKFPFRARLGSFLNDIAERWQCDNKDGAAMLILAAKDNNGN
jgi:ubiquinone/menaquinone biosynthesis C-methylase UbiE